jgi:hypothetical protein
MSAVMADPAAWPSRPSRTTRHNAARHGPYRSTNRFLAGHPDLLSAAGLGAKCLPRPAASICHLAAERAGRLSARPAER